MLVAAVRGEYHHEGDALGSSATQLQDHLVPCSPGDGLEVRGAACELLQRSRVEWLKQWAISRLAGTTTLPLRPRHSKSVMAREWSVQKHRDDRNKNTGSAYR
jgi:hypothetical protein